MTLKQYPIYGQPITKEIPEPATTFFYDRNPIVIGTVVAPGAIGPHADTLRASYTVPSGKRTVLEMADLFLEIVTAAGPSGNKRADIRWTPAGGSDTQFIRANLLASSNAIGDKETKVVGLSAMFQEGDLIGLRTADLGTGGTIEYEVKLKWTEFER